jgi:hypothetical protein
MFNTAQIPQEIIRKGFNMSGNHGGQAKKEIKKICE